MLAARPRLIRTFEQFAEEALVIPEGNFRGQRFRFHRQAFNRLLLREFDKGDYNTFATMGCVQSGKTLTCWVLPIVYHLFERQESVIAGVPTMDVAGDKFREEILPVILANPEWAELMPDIGPGSRGGGRLEAVKFKNGATLKFMSGRGRDEKRSSFTARVVCCTEVDKFDEAGTTSREADPITQLINRTSSFGQNRRIYLECTVSVPDGRIYVEYKAGTASRLVCPCPHCSVWVTPEKEHFLDFQQPDQISAGEQARFVCPACGQTITESQRKQMNADGTIKLLHRGQTITKDGTIQGDAPRTDTLGFRWNAFNNTLMWDTEHLGREEWKSWRSDDDVSAEKERLQFRWAEPWHDTAIETIDLKIDDVVSQRRFSAKSQLPEGTQYVTIGTDVGGKVLHWTVIAWLKDGRGHIVDYGTTGVLSRKMGFENAIKDAVQRLYERLGEVYKWKLWYFDARWKPKEVIAAIRELKDRTVRPSFGLGSGQMSKVKFRDPKGDKGFTFRGKRMYEKFRPEYKTICMSCDADYWKTWLHEAFTLHIAADNEDDAKEVEPETRVAALSLYESTDETEHVQFAKHLTAEQQKTVFEKGKGERLVWVPVRSANHWLDSTSYACVAGHRCGFELAKENKPTQPAAPSVARPQPQMQNLPPMPDSGRPYMVTDR